MGAGDKPRPEVHGEPREGGGREGHRGAGTYGSGVPSHARFSIRTSRSSIVDLVHVWSWR